MIPFGLQISVAQIAHARYPLLALTPSLPVIFAFSQSNIADDCDANPI
jgi:hypothetical protein